MKKADILADAWQPILHKPATDASCIKRVIEWDHKVDERSPDQAAIADILSEDEIRTALRACKRGKAAGLDRLDNGWYRDYEKELVPILIRLLNLWYDAGHFPKSFLQADIFCLKKGGSSSDALNFRPLALISTDYKIFTRVLATRVGLTLPDTIHPHQNGFGSGRTINDTLDLYSAAQNMVITDPTQQDATALLLDFRKAYDSLDMEYMLDVLRRKGYPEKFIRAVDAIHDGTTVRFLANGYTSRSIAVISDTRQGCPLAPLLFILALDPLYRKLDGFMGIRGVIIQSEAGRFELRVAGYADDTAAFVRNPADIPILTRDLSIFGNASGLQINAGKTKVIALHPRGPQLDIILPPDLTYQKQRADRRYLGIQVGSRIAEDTTWRAAIAKLEVRLLSKWVELGTKNLHNAGDILYHDTKPGLAPKVYITPDYTPAAQNHVENGPATPGGNWRTGTGSGLRDEGAGPVRIPDRRMATFAEANAVQAYTRDGIRTTLAKASGLLWTEGTLISDVVTWTRLEKGELVFKFAKKSIQQELRQQGENLVTIIIANYVELALRRPFPQEVHFTATPATHPVIAELRNGEEVELLIKDSVTGPTTIRPITNHEGMKSALTRFMAPDATVHAVHPHPHLSRLVCLWAGRRRWTRPRRDYKYRVADAARRRGEAKQAERAEKWNNESREAAAGLNSLEWKRLRKIVRLGAWGEQMLLRLKLHDFSTYDEAGLERSFFGLQLQAIPAGIWDVAAAARTVSRDQPQHFTEMVTKLVDGSWRLGVAIYFQSVWRWRVNFFDPLNNVTEGHHAWSMSKKLRQGYSTIHLHLNAHGEGKISDMVVKAMGRVLGSTGGPIINRIATQTNETYVLIMQTPKSAG
ncbi:unnamed protein product [Phytophthora fragariaefolia]|uniref:Unnamed protein product n=1 Tax=Phytophthora fragariaefolia TaxID=1490495 RepID=A0A9W7D1L8_9STRA|nr:unnamed protein product [Phytophthora fragariaefolia]